MVTLYLISFARSFCASWLTGGCYRVFTWLCIVISAFRALEKPLSCTRTSSLQSHFFLLAWQGMRPRGVAPPLSSVFAFLSLGHRKLASVAAASYILTHTFLFTTSLFLFHAHIHTHPHREENLYVSDIQQGKDKGTELITHHLLPLRRADGSRRYVNGKGQWIIRFF